MMYGGYGWCMCICIIVSVRVSDVYLCKYNFMA